VHPGTPGKLNGALYKQAGNSIPVPIFESIFRKMLLGEIREVEEQQLKII
jgi:DNA (cytosine-5)-methyltransferase 1